MIGPRIRYVLVCSPGTSLFLAECHALPIGIIKEPRNWLHTNTPSPQEYLSIFYLNNISINSHSHRPVTDTRGHLRGLVLLYETLCSYYPRRQN